MLTIHLKPIGRKHQRSFRVVVAERRSRLIGMPKEDLGFYNPVQKEAEIKKDRVAYWLSVGAMASPTVHNLLVREKVISAPKVPIKMKSKKVSAVESATRGARTESAPPAVPVEAKKEEGGIAEVKAGG